MYNDADTALAGIGCNDRQLAGFFDVFGKILSIAAPVAAFIPGIGPILPGILTAAAGALNQPGGVGVPQQSPTVEEQQRRAAEEAARRAAEEEAKRKAAQTTTFLMIGGGLLLLLFVAGKRRR